MNNQAIGIIPMLLSMILDLYVSYIVSFLVGISLCLLLLFVFHLLVKKDIYQFLLLPTLLAYMGYSFFLFFDLQSLHIYSPIVAEILLVCILGFARFFRRSILYRSKDWLLPQQVLFRSTLNEAFFIAEILQTLYTLYLFVALLYTHLPEDSFHSSGFIRIFYHYVGALIGVVVIVYGQIRTYMLYRKMEEEIWLPVLNNKGRIVGSVAYSIERMSHRKYYHPVVRIAAVYKGMLYLKKRETESFVSPGLLDHPFHKYILFRHSRESVVQDIIGNLKDDASAQPRFMIHYTFENNKVKQLVSLYAVTLRTEEQLKHLTAGKLWTTKQIEAEMEAGIFSEYFCKEFPYLQSTVLLAESISP
ncbi:MAG: hypothetical protein LBP25_04245 [Tannerellaceae bacterium]|nr:hypothetical protein [Tannerellaceae bacterium]